jgi:hypothetical protein
MRALATATASRHWFAASARNNRSVDRENEMALELEGLVDGGVHAKKTLGRASRPEPLQFALSPSDRSVEPAPGSSARPTRRSNASAGGGARELHHDAGRGKADFGAGKRIKEPAQRQALQIGRTRRRGREASCAIAMGRRRGIAEACDRGHRKTGTVC